MSEFAVGETVITSSDGEFYTAKVFHEKDVLLNRFLQ